MAITEETRHHLYQRLEGVLGPEEAWRRRSADGVDWYLRSDDTGIFRVATKHDLDHVAEVLGLRIDHLEERMEHRFTESELRWDERFASGLASLEVRLLSAFSDARDELRAESVAFRDESRTESAAFRETWHAEQRAHQRQVIVLLLVALVSLVAASVGLR